MGRTSYEIPLENDNPGESGEFVNPDAKDQKRDEAELKKMMDALAEGQANTDAKSRESRENENKEAGELSKKLKQEMSQESPEEKLRKLMDKMSEGSGK